MNITRLQHLARCVAIGLSLLLVLPAHAETISYQHDNNGNITQRGTTTYNYDSLGRLISESGPAKTQSITYDANGNRLSDGAGAYTYAPTSNRMLTRRGLAVTTDVLGNITADGTGREYVFNQARQLAQVKQGGILIATYTYDHAGLRISKVTTASAPQGAQTVIYEYDEQGHIIAEFSGTGAPIRAYIWLDDTPLSQIEYVPSRKIYYFNVDHLNTPRSLMDDTGNTVWRWDSDAFGSTLPNEDVDGDGVKITSNLRFPGQYYDKETGLHHNWHRYYDPTMGQYIQADPIGLAAGTNLYTYVRGNPLGYVDPFGLYCLSDAQIGAIAGTIGGGYAGGVTGFMAGGIPGAVTIGLLGAGAGGLAGALTNTPRNAMVGGAVSGGLGGANSPSAGAVGGLVGGAVAVSAQSSGLSPGVSMIAGGGVGGAAGGALGGIMTGITAGASTGGLIGLSSAALTAGIIEAIKAGNNCPCGSK